MIFNNLGDIFYIIHALESINTSICLTDAHHEIIYESSSKECKHMANEDEVYKIIDTLQHTQKATFKILLIDCWITAITTVAIVIDGKLYSMELKQFISKIIKYSSSSPNFENLSIHQIKEMAITDALTKLYNRRYIDERLPIDMQSSFELDKPISILFLDIDYFKSINDTYGHATGDQVLQEMAVLLQRYFKKGNGWVARYGGDEILVCLPGCAKKSAKRTANRLRKTIETHTFYTPKQQVHITSSIGVYTALRDTGIKNVAELMLMADKSLYQAKNQGRNKVV
jgi:diguanylate cyclase (GGDEF)-like protein